MNENDIRKIQESRFRPYRKLLVSLERLKQMTEEERDKYIAERRDLLLYSKHKTNSPFVSDLRRNTIMSAYELIKDEKSRIEYDKKWKENERPPILETFYNYSEKYDEKQILNVKRIKRKIDEDKIKDEVQGYTRKDNKQLLVYRSGGLVYTNWSHKVEDEISEYEILRKIDGEEVHDTVYVNLLEGKLKTDATTGEREDQKYYDFVINGLFSDDCIDGCTKYNHGYLGSICEKDGKYVVEINEEELSAVMKYYGERSVSQEMGESRE